jgi:hypothetical protein
MAQHLTGRLQNAAGRLQRRTRLRPFSGRFWRKEIPRRPGVYAIWTSKAEARPVYVGETANLHERMSDLGSYRNHTFAKKVKARHRLGTAPEVRALIKRRFFVSCIAVAFGRKEIEESLVVHWKTATGRGYNQSGSRRWRCDA